MKTHTLSVARRIYFTGKVHIFGPKLEVEVLCLNRKRTKAHEQNHIFLGYHDRTDFIKNNKPDFRYFYKGLDYVRPG